MTPQRWEVLTLIGNHWENVWSLDEEPETFASYEDASIALEEHLLECRGAVKAGHLEDMPTRDAFRIAPYGAPDLLAALGNTDPGQMGEITRAAIAKAEGRK